MRQSFLRDVRNNVSDVTMEDTAGVIELRILLVFIKNHE